MSYAARRLASSLVVSSLVLGGVSTAAAQSGPTPAPGPAAAPDEAAPAASVAAEAAPVAAPAAPAAPQAVAAEPAPTAPTAPAGSDELLSPVDLQPTTGSYYASDATPGHDHKGFFLRLVLGPAYTSMSARAGSDDVGISGGGIGGAAAIGGAVAENLILYTELFNDVAIGPTAEVNGTSREASDDVQAGVVGVGVGVAYYFMPSNAYVSGTLAATRLAFDNTETSGDEENTQWGAGVSLMAGKEWWISEGWGLGIAAQLVLASMEDNESPGSPTWDTSAFALLFSATYN